MLMRNMALVKVAPAECISEPGPSLVQYPVRAKATPIRLKDFVMYQITDKDARFFQL